VLARPTLSLSSQQAHSTQHPKIMEQDYDFLCKMVVVGDSAVGKSSLIYRYTDDDFSTSHMPTIGVDFRIRTVEERGRIVKMQVWDTAGQERFHAIMPTYYRNAMAVALVYDVHRIETFDSLQKWHREVFAFANPDAAVIVIGNKRDKTDSPVAVPAHIAQNFADRIGASFIETSAKTSRNVEAAFNTVIADFVDRHMLKPIVPKAKAIVPKSQSFDVSSRSKCFCV
jgi:small GTP-binding protein